MRGGCSGVCEYVGVQLCSRVVQSVAECCSVLQCVAVHFGCLCSLACEYVGVQLCVAVCCSVLQCVAVHFGCLC